MNKQYIFLIMLWIILYILYLITSFTIKEYKVNQHIETLENFILETKTENKKTTEMIDYKLSEAYRNYIRKDQGQKKNKWEVVIYMTTQQKYNKYTQEAVDPEKRTINPAKTYSIINNMTIGQKWKYKIFQKHIY